MALWRRHRWTALRSLLVVALLHRLHCLAFLAASSPVWLLAAFLLGVVLVHSEPASEDEHRHRHVATTGGSSDDTSSGAGSSDDTSSMDMVHLAGEKEDAVKAAAVAWTADDEHSIRSIGSLELERDARLEKLMSRRSIHRNLIDLDIHIPKNNPLDESSDPGSAPSFLLAQHNSNPFDFDFPADQTLLLRRHESFTAGAAPLAARPSRFRPYFVADVPEGGAGDADSSSSSSPAAAAAATPPGIGMVDVELISDSSDDDMSLPGAAAGSLLLAPDEADVEDSFEVESITQQVAAAGTTAAAVFQLSSTIPPPPPQQQHHYQPTPAAAASPPAAPLPPTPAAPAPTAPSPAALAPSSAKPSKSKAASKKAVFGFFRK